MKRLFLILLLLSLVTHPMFGATLNLGTGGLLKFGTSSYENWGDAYCVVNTHFGIAPTIADIYNSGTYNETAGIGISINGVSSTSFGSESYDNPLIGSASFKFSRLSGNTYSAYLLLNHANFTSRGISVKVNFKVGRLPLYPDGGFGQVYLINGGSSSNDLIQLYLQRTNSGGVYSNTLNFNFSNYTYSASFIPQLNKWYTIRIWTTSILNSSYMKHWHIEVPEANISYTSPGTSLGYCRTGTSYTKFLYEYTNIPSSDSFLTEADELYISAPPNSIYPSSPEPPSAPIEFQTPRGAKLNLGE